MADTQVFAAQGNHGAGTEAKTFRSQDAGFDHVQASFQTSVHLQANLMAQTVFDQRLVGFRQAQFPRQSSVLHRTQWAGAGAAVESSDGNQVGIRLGHTYRDGADAGAGHQFHGNQGFGIDHFQIED